MKSSARTYPGHGNHKKTLWAAMACLLGLPLCLRAEWKTQPATEWSEEVRVWDPSPELNLEFRWNGPVTADNKAGGQGTLEWRDTKGPVSIYEGTLVGGKREGNGTWLHRSGSKYSGEWRDNLKHGRGEYWLKNGDYYSGGFREDKLDGQGRYVFADGSIYEGTFAGGNKQGAGTMTLPDGRIHRSTWENDEDTQPPAPPSEPYVVLGIDNSNYALDGKVLFSGSTDSHECYLTYRGQWTGDGYSITPDWPYWVKWQKGGPVGGGAMSNFDVGVYPAFLEMRVYNPSGEKITISSAEIEVTESRPDKEPILEVLDGYAKLSVEVSSFDRKPIQPLKLSFNLLPPGQPARFGDYRFQMEVPGFIGQTTVSLEQAFAELGADLSVFREWEALTKQQEEGGPEMDYQAVEEQKRLLMPRILQALAPIEKFVEKDKETDAWRVEARFVGEMELGWTDEDGTEQKKTVKLDFPKTFFVSSPEFGAGGPDSGKYDVLLEATGKNYVKPFNYKRVLAAGANDRFGIQLASTQSSLHDFRVRLVTTDGRELLSPPCRMHFLVPGGFDWQRGFTVEE